jgi:predicted metal-dependent hydrolase
MIILIIIILLLFCFIYYLENRLYVSENLTMVQSSVDNKSYLVRNVNDKNQAANTLAKMKSNMIKLVDHLKENKDEFPENLSYIKDLISRSKNINIMESSSDEKYTSYTINKGEKIVFCIRSKDLNDIHDINTLMYVAIHELAHVGCPEYGHTPLFKEIFIFLLKESVKIGIYKKVDYRVNPKVYCGMTINEYLFD